MEVRQALIDELRGLDLTWPNSVTHHRPAELPVHLPILVQAYADEVEVPWVAIHGGRLLGAKGELTPKHRQRPLREVYRLGPSTRLVLELYVEDRVLEGVWARRARLIEDLLELGFDLVLAPNLSVWRDAPRISITWNPNEEDGWGIGPAPWLDASSHRAASASVAARTLRTVAWLTLDAGTARAAQLPAARDFFGHDFHLLFCGQPAGAIAEVATVGSQAPEESDVERLQLLIQDSELCDAPSGVRDFVSDQVPETVAFRTSVYAPAGQQITHLLQRDAERLRAKEELKPANGIRAVHAVAGVGPRGRRDQAFFLVVANSRGGDANELRQFPDLHPVLAHGWDATPSTWVQGQALSPRWRAERPEGVVV